METINPKSNRVLELYRDFLSGKIINKHERAAFYNVTERSIQRDIDTIREFLSEQLQEKGISQKIEYSRKDNGYHLVSQHTNYLSKGELLAICKILISSRVYTKEDLRDTVERLLNFTVSSKDKQEIEDVIANEIFHYITPTHPRFDPNYLWKVVEAIRSRHKLEITYSRLKEKRQVVRLIEPVGILFSEYYFYLMAQICDLDKESHFDNKNDHFPTIYRLDRILNLSVSNQTFSINYTDRFKEGEYKNRVQFMYGGEPQHIKFEYTGPSIEAILDRLPLSQITQKDTGNYIVDADVFGSGIKMWLLSQGKWVRVLEPQKLADDIKEEIEAMQVAYKNNDK